MNAEELPVVLRWRTDLAADRTLSWRAKSAGAHLANYMDAHGIGAWPALRTLAADMGVGKRSAMRGLEELEANGWVTASRRRATTTVFDARFPSGAAQAPLTPEALVVPDSHPVVSHSHPLVPDSHHRGAPQAPEVEKEVVTEVVKEVALKGRAKRAPRTASETASGNPQSSTDEARVSDDRKRVWLRQLGPHFAHDPEAFAEEAAAALKVGAVEAEELRLELLEQAGQA
jgi:Helix-turn-helix domain